MKDPKSVRWFTLLLALGLLYVGIDRMFFDKSAGIDFLSRIERILAIAVGVLLSAVSASFFVAAWRGRSPVTAMYTNSLVGKLLVDAFGAGLGAFVIGLCLAHTIARFDSLYLTVMILFGVAFIADLLWTRGEVRRLASGETARKQATQFLWSCVFFSMLCFMSGMVLSGVNGFNNDFLRRFSVVFWITITGVGIYPVRRDAKRLAEAAGANESKTSKPPA